MNRRMVLYVTGRVTFVVGVLMILPILVALIYHEGTDTIYPLFQAMVATMAVGAAMASRPPKRRSIYVREGLAITGLSWIMLVIFGSLPYLFTGAIPSIPDAIFETASGFTTTGSSILSEIESLPRSVLFWRNFTVFIGGMGVLVFAVALLPKSNSEDIYILKSEMPGPTFDKVLSRVRTVARVFYVIYAVLTLILICILIGAGMSPYDAILHAFATAGTGGFSNYNTSIAAFESVPIELILAFGMLIFSVNFNLYFFALRGRWREALKSDELRWFDHWRQTRMKWHRALGFGDEHYRFHDHDKLAHYANAATDVEFEFPFGFKEVEGIHSRTDFDLGNHAKFSGKKIQYYDTETGESYVPYVVETSIGVDRMVLQVLSAAYKEERLENGETRTVLNIPAAIAPVKAAIFPLVKKDGLPELAHQIKDMLKFDYNIQYDEKDSIGKRYRRQDAIGTPLCITVDYQSLEDKTVTVRHRDSMQQHRVAIADLAAMVGDEVSLRKLFSKIV